MTIVIYLLLCVSSLITTVNLTSNNNIDLPEEFLGFYFSKSIALTRDCLEDDGCPYKAHLRKDVCWGYESKIDELELEDCDLQRNSYSHPICDEEHKGYYVKSKAEQLATFYKQGDFGFIKDVRNSFTLVCQPTYREDSSLECAESMTFCRGRNLMIDFRDLETRTKPVMYDMDVLKHGQIGGHCKLLEENFKKTQGPVSPLQSWTPELQHFVALPGVVNRNSSTCDRIIKRPTFIMKLDATVSYYHHFCDFINLYMSLHVNSTVNGPDPFTKDVNILIWRTYEYSSNFAAAFRPFTSHRILSLNDFKGKRVCFENVVFPLLPRMIFGLYYNTPLIGGCRNSGLFQSFSQFMLHRLRIQRRTTPEVDNIHVTFISRKTAYRKVLNEDILIDELKKIPELVVNKAEFTWSTPFTEQLQVIQNTDILIGIHGAGLTHMLFLPDWAAVFELYNCEDENCYADLARLRGLHYGTWEDVKKLKSVDKDPSLTGGAHEKHTNYIFDPKEFMRLVQKSIDHIKSERRKRLADNEHDEL